MTLTELRYIVAVADACHFGRAAERCHVSQPSLSASIAKLEDELGIKLFERSRRGAKLTAAGEEVIAQARRALDEAARVKTVAQQGRNPLKGILRLGVIHTIAPYLLPDLVAALHRAAPEMPLDIEENTTAALDGLLKAGTLDVVVLALPYEESGILTQALYDEPFKVIVPRGHPLARRKTISADELDVADLLLLPVGHCLRDQVLDACREFTRPPPPGRQGNSLETLRSMVASGMGISVLPASALTARYANPLIKVIDFASPVPMRRVALAWRKGFARPAAVAQLAETIRRLALPVQRLSADSGRPNR
ncbi:MAG: hydrogen peroxide-inducible genes activator [Betaproteobacteria bacterium]|jgi:LysR family hydrogen peroxide-inducible transcriptional activator|nr:hydrogen peroxide-inducible genes activator [Betaproteobacteria bacterium]